MKIFRSFKDLQNRLYNNDFSCEELVRFYLSQIKEKDIYNSFIETFNDSAIEQAKTVDQDISNK